MSRKTASNQIEILESRIAPAILTGFFQAPVGSPILLQAGTNHAGIEAGGAFLVHVEAGKAIIFTTDFNENGQIDPNEITGIAAGDHLQITLFTDVHGDIITNLRNDGTLSDDGNPNNNDPVLKGDGTVLLNNHIDRITLRSLTTADLSDQNGDGVVNSADVQLRLALSSYSIFGNIIAGAGIGTPDGLGGIIIDVSGKTTQASKFAGDVGGDLFHASNPEIGSVLTGSAASGQFFHFGVSNAASHIADPNDPLNPNAHKHDIMGNLLPFLPPTGQSGGDINGISARSFPGDTSNSVVFSIGTVHAGNGGFGAHGGDISNVSLHGDVGGYDIIAGNGGQGNVGGTGGNIVNFTDNSSITSQIHIVSGDGGQGLVGAGGNGGSAQFGVMNIYGGVSINLGNGGNGFGAGGNGASLQKGIFTTPDGTATFGLSITGTMHTSNVPLAGGSPVYTPTIGTSDFVDFNGDGFGDAVYTTSAPDQLVVLFGDGTGQFYTDANGDNPAPIPTLEPTFLNSPLNAKAVTIGDFNGDGVPDIATASADAGSNGGVSVYLTKYSDANHDGILTSDEFVGFTLPRHSTLPTLNTFLGSVNGGFFRTSGSIVALAAGDFNGDGITDIGVVADYTSLVTQTVFHVVVIMTGDNQVIGTANHDFGAGPTGPVNLTSGLFYADFGTNAANQMPLVNIGKSDAAALLKATALADSTGVTPSTADVLIASRVGDTALTIIDNSGGNPAPTLFNVDLGQVDTNRTPGADKITLTAAHALDFAVVDYNSDGNADLVTLLNNPAKFLVSLKGDGAGGMAITSGNGVDQAGITFGGDTSALKRIVATDANQDGLINDVAIYDVFSDNTVPVASQLSGFGNPPAGAFIQRGDLTVTTQNFPITVIPKDATVIAFDAYRPLSPALDPTPFTFNYLNIEPQKVLVGDWSTTAGQFESVSNNGFFVQAGDGGNSTAGVGGTGGLLGGTPLTLAGGGATTQAAVNANLSFQFPGVFPGRIDLFGGSGGNGFKSGGTGGGITGVRVDYPEGVLSFGGIATLTAGDGGNGITGAGGSGGNLSSNTTITGEFFQAGTGGNGTTGGNGGSVIGNGLAGVFDNQDIVVTVLAGNGGGGIKGGGAGGSITGFIDELIPFIGGPEGGSLDYEAGNGGNAVSGSGGHGGSVLNSSPTIIENNLAGPLTVFAGAGGKGLTGGAGGSIVNFHDAPSTQGAIPTIVSFISGNGGQGITGNGGNGGGLSDVSSPGTAFDVPNSLSLINRFIAGNGGDSFGANGGSGGALSGLNATATRGAAVGAAGAGGFGLLSGGSGGSVVSSEINASLPTGEKVLIVGGKGGDALGFVPTATTPVDLARAFGGKAGVGGNGGNIIDYTQRGSISTRVDLIAGNGGDTPNYGTSQDTVVHVGKGGSIANASLDGNIGNIDPSVAIKAYNAVGYPGDGISPADYHPSMSMAGFIAQITNDPTFTLDDTVGNVGLVAGAAGRVKNDQPATAGINGSVTNLTALNIMSMIAGGIDRVQAIQSASGIHITGTNGDKGTDKDFPPLTGATGTFDYLDTLGNVVSSPGPSTVPLGGALIDGYIVTKSPISGLPPGGRVVVPA